MRSEIKLKLQEPLINVGKKIRKRFMLLADELHIFGERNQDRDEEDKALVQDGNEAAN
jgi:hypothetical protein